MSCSSTTSVNSDSASSAAASDPSVIVGFAFRFPGASNVSQLWDAVTQKRDLRRKIPEDRFNIDAYHHPVGANKGTVSIQHSLPSGQF
jgi:acyl transferase domain-containing protein